MMTFCCQADNDPLIVVLGSSLPATTKKANKQKQNTKKNNNKINVVKFGPPLTKLSGSAHGLLSFLELQVCRSLVFEP